MGCGPSSGSARPLDPASDSMSSSTTPGATADACAAKVKVAATTPLGRRSDISQLSAAFWGFVVAAEASGLEATLADLERFVDEVSIANLRSLFHGDPGKSGVFLFFPPENPHPEAEFRRWRNFF